MIGSESKKYGTEDRQKQLLIMIEDVDKLLRENGIKYSLCGGTLLGAVREHGFIPWDDDIDIMVDRENWMKIKRLFYAPFGGYKLTRYLWVEHIKYEDEETEDLMAPQIDVFVGDHRPNNRIFAAGKLLVLRMLQGMIKKDIDYKGKSVVYRICLWITHMLGHLFSDRTKNKWYDQISQWGNSKQADHICLYNDLFTCMGLGYTDRLFHNYTDMEFEHLRLPATCEYDNFLTLHYGDYMTPPQEEDRKPIHM